MFCGYLILNVFSLSFTEVWLNAILFCSIHTNVTLIHWETTLNKWQSRKMFKQREVWHFTPRKNKWICYLCRIAAQIVIIYVEPENNRYHYQGQSWRSISVRDKRITLLNIVISRVSWEVFKFLTKQFKNTKKQEGGWMGWVRIHTSE